MRRIISPATIKLKCNRSVSMLLVHITRTTCDKSSLTEASYVGCRGTINISILPGSNTTASQTIIWRNIKQSPPKYIQLYLPWRLSRLASIFDNWGKLSVWFPFYFRLWKEGYWTKGSRPEPCSSLGIAVSARLLQKICRNKLCFQSRKKL